MNRSLMVFPEYKKRILSKLKMSDWKYLPDDIEIELWRHTGVTPHEAYFKVMALKGRQVLRPLQPA